MRQDADIIRPDPSHVLRRGHGFLVDHIALGVPDTQEGVKQIEARTGAKVNLHDPEPGQWYWSGSLAIAEDSFLEIIGPNPEWRGFQPFRALLQSLSAPQLVFWYIATPDFAAFRAYAESGGVPLERVEQIGSGDPNDRHSSYIRGVIGPGFISQRPSVIEWIQRGSLGDPAPECRLTSLRLAHPKAAQINRTFQHLGLDIAVKDGPSSIGISLDTPNGPVDFDNPGIAFAGLSAVIKIVRLWLAHRN